MLKLETFIHKPTEIKAQQINTQELLDDIRQKLESNGIVKMEVELGDWIVMDEFNDCSFLPDQTFNMLYESPSKIKIG